MTIFKSRIKWMTCTNGGAGPCELRKNPLSVSYWPLPIGIKRLASYGNGLCTCRGYSTRPTDSPSEKRTRRRRSRSVPEFNRTNVIFNGFFFVSSTWCILNISCRTRPTLGVENAYATNALSQWFPTWVPPFNFTREILPPLPFLSIIIYCNKMYNCVK